MSKKKFLTAKNFFIWIIFFLFFSENIFWFSFDSRKDFYENFYSNIYDETDYKKKSLERISDETWLDEKFLLSFYNWSWATLLDTECKTNKWPLCKIVNLHKNTELFYSNILTNKINSELKLVKLEQKLKSTAEDEEIFADWDYDNSFFDIVTQWNIIDVILFWKDWMTPFFKYKKDNKKEEKKSDNNNQKPDQKIKNQKENKYKEDKISFFDDKTKNFSENKTEKTKNWFYLNTIKNQNKKEEELQICLDPNLININSLNKKRLAQKWEKSSTLDKTLQENNKINSINWEKIKSENENSIDLKKNQTSKNWFVKPKDDWWEECKKPLYWWYICLDDISKWNCYKIWKDWKNWSFCWEINMITDSQDLLWNIKWDNSINWYISKWLKIIEDKIYWEALFPRENSLNNWNLPNLIWTKRDFSFLDISWMAMPWEKENYKKNERKPQINLEEKYNPDFQDKIWQAQWDIVKLEKLLSEKTAKEYKDLNKTKILSQEKAATIKDAYFWDINWRITEFRNLFQNWILENINWLPFEKLKKLPSCQEIKNN